MNTVQSLLRHLATRPVIRAARAVTTAALDVCRQSLAFTLSMMLIVGQPFFLSTRAYAQTADPTPPPAPTYSPTLKTDKLDYAPTTTVQLTGAGFKPNEIVTLQVVHIIGENDPDPGDLPWDVQADATGAFATTWYVPWDAYLDTMLATAYGNESKALASATFTDASDTMTGWCNTTLDWRGSTNANQSHWAEGDTIPLRIVLTSVSAGQIYDVKLKYDFALTQNANEKIHLFDGLRQYNTTYNPTTPPAHWSPTDGTSITAGPDMTTEIPQDPSAGVPQFNSSERGKFAVYNAKIVDASGTQLTTIPSTAWSAGTAGNGTTRILSFKIKIDAGQSSAVIVYGGHLASPADWGFNTTTGASNGASSFNGGSGKAYENYDNNSQDKNFQLSSAGGSAIQKFQSITFPTPPPQVYSGNNIFTLSATASSGLAVTYKLKSVSGGVTVKAGTNTISVGGTISGNQVTVIGVGSATITASQGGDTTWAAASDVDATCVVTQAPLTITASNDSKTYGQTKTYGAGSTAFSSSGLVNSETIGSVTITDTNNGGDAHANVSGTYPLHPSAATGGTFTASNYNISYVNGALTINRAAATVSVTGYDVAYDGNSHIATGAATGVFGETLAGLDLSGTSRTNPGTTTDNWTFTDTTGNYANQSGTVTDKIGKADSTTTVTVSNATYDNTQHGGTANVTGVGGLNQPLTVNYAGTGITGTTTTAPTNAGSYTASASFAGDTTHNGSSDSKPFTISPATSTTTVTVSDATFDNIQHGGTANVTGVGGLNQPLTVNYSGTGITGSTTTAPTNAGSYTASASFAGDTNHTGSNDSKNFTIGVAGSTTLVTAANATYDGNSHGGTANVTGIGGLNQSLTVSYSGTGIIGTTTTAPTNAGNYTASASFAGDANHSSSSDSKNFTISPASSATTVTVGNATYDGNAHGGTASVTGAGGLSQSLTVTYSGTGIVGTTTTAPTDAGSYTASASYSGDSNHTGSSDSQNFTISPAGSTTVVSVSNATYDGNQHGGTANVSGVGGLNSSLTVSYSGTGIVGTTTTAPTNAGSYIASASFVGDGNHTGSSDSKPFTISPAGSSTVVMANDAVYDGNPHGGTANVTGGGGLNQPLTVTYTGTTSKGESYGPTTTPPTVPGDYTASASYSDDNHTPSSDSKNFKISKAPATGVLSGETDQGLNKGTSNTLANQTSFAGQAVTLHAEVNGVTGGGTPTGTVKFYQFLNQAEFDAYNALTTDAARVAYKAARVGTINFGTGVITPATATIIDLSTSGGGASTVNPLNATTGRADLGPLNYPILAVGHHLLAFDYSGDSNYASFDPVMDWGVVQVPTSTSVTASASPIYGTAITFTATVTSSKPEYANFGSAAYSGHVFVEGTVTFKDGSTIIATIPAAGYGQTNGTLVVSTTYSLPAGHGHTITAEFSDGLPTDPTPGAYGTSSSQVTPEVAKADPTITVNGYTVDYDGNSHTATGSATGIGGAPLAGLDLSGTSHTGAGTFNDSWTFTDVTGNYNNKSGNVTDKINKIDPSITVNGYTVDYDGNSHTATGSATGIGGAPLAGLDLSGTSHTGASTYNDSWTFTDVTGNYNNKSGNVTDKINKVDPSITVNGYTVDYDGNSHTATGSATGVGGAPLSGLNLTGTSHTGAGTYNDSWTFTDVTGNYNNKSGNVTDKINKIDPSITVNGYTVDYDGNSHTATGSATGVGGASLAGLDLSGTNHTGAGTYNDSWTFTDVTGNYNNKSGNVTDKINKVDPSITVNGYTVDYDGNSHTATGSATGVGGASLAGLNLAGTNHTGAGTYNDSWTFTDVTGNYNNKSGNVTDKINKVDPSITVDGYTVDYDGNSHTATGSATGIGGAPLAGLDLSGTSHTGASTYNDSWTFTDVTGNYNNKSGNVTDKINKVDPSITVNGYTVDYDGNSHTATGSATGIGSAPLSGLNLTGTSHTGAGTYNDSWTFTDVTGNYNNKSGNVTDKINKIDPTISVTGYNVPYDGNSHTATGSATGLGGASLSGLNLSGTTHSNGGTYTDPWSFTDVTGNYNNKSGTVADAITKVAPSGFIHGITDKGLDIGVNSTGTTTSLTSVVGEAVTLAGEVKRIGLGTTPTGTVSFWQFPNQTDYNNYQAALAVPDQALAKTIKTTKAIKLGSVTMAAGTGAISPTTTNVTNKLTFFPATSGIGLSGSLTYPGLLPGPHYLTFDYDPNTYDGGGNILTTDTNYNAFDPGMNWGVDQAPTTTAVAVNGTPVFGTAVTFTATVTDSDPYISFSSNPEGSVTFFVDGSQLGTAINVTSANNGVITSIGATGLAAGTHTIKAVYSGSVAYLNSDSGTPQNFTVAKAPSVTTIIMDANGPEYYDCTPHGADHATVTGAGGLNIDPYVLASYSIVYTGTSNPNTPAAAPYGPTSVKPTLIGTYTAKSTYLGDDNHTGSSDTENFTIKGYAGAGPAGSLYTGALLFWTTGPSSSTASLALSCTVADIGKCHGDIRGATVTFQVSNDGTNFKDVPNAANLKVGLADPTKIDVGTASALAQWNMQPNTDVDSFVLKIVVGGNYTASTHIYTITVAKPGLTSQFVGGNSISNGAVAGFPASSGYLGVNALTDADSNTTVSATVKYNNKLTNPQGKVTVTFTTYNKADGTNDYPNIHTYIATSNAISELSQNPSKLGNLYSFSSKVTLKEIVGNGTTGVDSGNMMNITLIPGTTGPTGTNPDRMGIQIQRSQSMGGGLWFSTSWGSASPGALPSTLNKPIAGGDIVTF